MWVMDQKGGILICGDPDPQEGFTSLFSLAWDSWPLVRHFGSLGSAGHGIFLGSLWSRAYALVEEALSVRPLTGAVSC